MGIIRAALSAVGGGLADQWLEVIEPDNMSDTTVLTSGVPVRRNDRRNQNRKGSQNYISDGSIIQVGEAQCMLLVDGGKIVDYSAEAGYYKVQNSGTPSIFNGRLMDSVKETFSRVKYGGIPSVSQRVFYINTQEIKNIPFGTVNPVNYFDNFYNAELYLRAHGYFSIRIVDPLKFYTQAIPKNADRVDITDINKLYLAEFLTALQTALGKMSVDGIRISHIQSKSQDLASYMSSVLDEEWTSLRGMLIESVGIASISYDEESRKLIAIRSQGAMLSDPGIREGYVQGSVARGIEAAGSNSAGAMGGFVGLGMGMQAGGGFVGAASAANQAQLQRDAEKARSANNSEWTCSCGTKNTGKYCHNCGKERSASGKWICSCGAKNTGNFCPECGKKRPSACPKCGSAISSGAKFCPECGEKLD